MESVKNSIIKDILKEVFGDACYTCIKSQDKWGDETLSKDDFICVAQNEILLDEMVSKMDLLDNVACHELEDIILSYEIFYNEDIENNFCVDAFEEDVLGLAVDSGYAVQRINKVKKDGAIYT